jgi:hypothetical protein
LDKELQLSIQRGIGEVDVKNFLNEQLAAHYGTDGRFVMIDTWFISRNNVPTQMSELEMKVYLYLCTDMQPSFRGHHDFSKYCKCSLRTYQEVIARLEGKGLIRTCQKSKRETFKSVNMLPFYYYDAALSRFVIRHDQQRYGFSFDNYNINFLLIPVSVLKEALFLPRKDLLALLTLYYYCNYSLFQGVDPNVLHYTSNNWSIHPKLYYDLYLTKEEFVESIHTLETVGIIEFMKVDLMEEVFDIEPRLRIAIGESSLIVAPKYQSRGEVDETTHRDN